MRELKKLLIGFLISAFSCVVWAQSYSIKENRVFKEAYGLYWSGKFRLALDVLEKNKSILKRPSSFYLMGLCYEALEEYDLALKYLGKAWREFPLHRYTLPAAVEEAAIRAYVMENPIGASVVLELALSKFKGARYLKQRCVLSYNLWYVKKKAGFTTDKELSFLKEYCKGFSLSSEEKIKQKGEKNTENNTGG